MLFIFLKCGIILVCYLLLGIKFDLDMFGFLCVI